jgi:lysozyme
MICEAAKKGIIMHFESLHDGDLSVIGLQPKMCPRKIWTVGYGRALMNASKTRFLMGEKDKAEAYKQYPALTVEESELMLDEDIARFEAVVKKLVKARLNENQRGALVSFTFNVGNENFKESTLLALLNAGDYKNAADQLLRWNKSGGKVLKGLTLRREAERELFLTAV